MVVLVELIYVWKRGTFFKWYFTSMQSHLMEKHFLEIIPSYMGRIFFENYPIPSHAENFALNFDHIRDILISLIQLYKFMVLPIANINWWYSCHEYRQWYATFYPLFFPRVSFFPFIFHLNMFLLSTQTEIRECIQRRNSLFVCLSFKLACFFYTFFLVFYADGSFSSLAWHFLDPWLNR